MPSTDKNKQNIMKWLGKNELSTCSCILDGVQETTMRNKAKRKSERETNRKVTIANTMELTLVLDVLALCNVTILEECWFE